MAEPTVGTFQQALGKMLALRDQILTIQKTITKAAGAVQDWKRLHVTHTEHKFPTSLVTDPTAPFVDARQWPSGEELARLLTDWRTARDEAERIWATLPPESRIGFRKPSDY